MRFEHVHCRCFGNAGLRGETALQEQVPQDPFDMHVFISTTELLYFPFASGLASLRHCEQGG